MTSIYIVSAFDMEPYSNYDAPARAFYSREEAERYIQTHTEVYDAGYYRWDETTETEVSCDENDEDAVYSYGWKYSSLIQEIELVESEK